MLPAFLSATRVPTTSAMSACASSSSMKACGIRPLMVPHYASPGLGHKLGFLLIRKPSAPWLLGREHRAHTRPDGAHVHAAGGARLDDAHHLAEVLDALRFRRVDRFRDQRVELGIAERLRQVALQHLDLVV